MDYVWWDNFDKYGDHAGTSKTHVLVEGERALCGVFVPAYCDASPVHQYGTGLCKRCQKAADKHKQ